jgi:hypothetical protein
MSLPPVERRANSSVRTRAASERSSQRPSRTRRPLCAPPGSHPQAGTCSTLRRAQTGAMRPDLTIFGGAKKVTGPGATPRPCTTQSCRNQHLDYEVTLPPPPPLRDDPARPAALRSSNRAALHFVPPSQGEGAEGGGGCVGRSPARTCAGTFTPTTPSLRDTPPRAGGEYPGSPSGRRGNLPPPPPLRCATPPRAGGECWRQRPVGLAKPVPSARY